MQVLEIGLHEELKLEDKKNLLWDKAQLRDLIDEYRGVGLVNLKATYNSQILWDAQVGHENSYVVASTNDSLFSSRVTNALDRIGATELSIAQVTLRKHMKTSEKGWEEWFLGYATLGYDLPTAQILLAPDTNFIKRRYASGLLRRLGGSRFRNLHFCLPTLVILEIEAIHNRNKKAVENLEKRMSGRKDRKTVDSKDKDEHFKASAEMRESLIATKEVLFLREVGALLLPSNIEEIRSNFLENAGKGFADIYIRKEIHDAVERANLNIRFLTCDLMNALSAVSEGLPSFYFSRVKSEKYYLSVEYETCLEQLADLIIDTTTTFGEITLNASSTAGKKDSKLLKWKWADWTVEDLLGNRIIEDRTSV